MKAWGRLKNKKLMLNILFCSHRNVFYYCSFFIVELTTSNILCQETPTFLSLQAHSEYGGNNHHKMAAKMASEGGEASTIWVPLLTVSHTLKIFVCWWLPKQHFKKLCSQSNFQWIIRRLLCKKPTWTYSLSKTSGKVSVGTTELIVMYFCIPSLIS